MKKIIASAIISLAILCAQTWQRAQAQFICTVGYAYGVTFLWLVPQSSLVVQYSATEVDFCAGLYYDPYVEGYLFRGNTLVAADYAYGFADIIPARVLLATDAYPSTVYTAFGEHYVVDCFEFCQYYYFGETGVQGITPPCLYSAASGVSGPDVIPPCPGPTPTPSPTPTPPTLTVTEVGFTGDLMITKWKDNPDDRIKIDNPDGTQPTWTKSRNSDLPVAYKRGTSPTVFATFRVVPALSTSRPASIRVKKDGNVIATKTGLNIGGGVVTVNDITVTGALESDNPPKAKKGEYQFAWEVSFDGGTNWASAGNSGKHKIFWTYDTPLSRPFKNIQGMECFPTSDGVECDTLYDEALKHSVGKLGNGSSDLAVIVDKINRAAAADFIYDPCTQEPVNQHPLKILNVGSSGQCSAQANLLRGLLKSIGIDASTQYFWGGNPDTGVAYLYNYVAPPPVTLRVSRRANNDGANQGTRCPDVQQNPHFSFHAVVSANGGTLYDPSYGLASTEAQVNLLEASKYPERGFLLGAAANDRKVQRSSFMSSSINTGTTCSHQPAAGNLFPNPIDDAETFVAQHYRDFLNREPDAGGLAYWTSLITSCNGEPQCIAARRVAVSKAFFLSVEFQQIGYFVHRFYKASYGRNPFFGESLTDRGAVAFDAYSPELLESNKQAYADDWVRTDEFQAIYQFMSDEQYVDALFANAGVTPSAEERASLINGLASGTETRATALRRIVDNTAFVSAEFNRAFVLMEYFGYLRRDPDQGGYEYWLWVLNQYNDQDGMVGAFVTSGEYRYRFGLP